MKTIGLAGLALCFCFHAAAADAIRFSETYAERVARDETGEVVIVPRISGSFSAKVTYPELGCLPVLSSTVFEFAVRGIEFQSSLGAADLRSPTLFTFFVRDEEGRRIGTIVLGRTFSQMIVTANFTAAMVAGDLVGGAGTVSDSTTVHLRLGDLVVERPVHFTARQSVLPRNLGVDELGEPQIVELHSIAVSGSADYTQPVLSLASPRAGQRFETETIELRGTARDNVAVDAVWCRVNGEDLEPAFPSPDSLWSKTVTLVPGTNVLSVWVADEDGNYSSTNTIKVFRVVTAPLSLSWDADGTVTGLTNGQPLEIGRSYKVTARPKTSFRFGGWNGAGNEGPVNSPGAVLTFTMQPGLALHASFIPPMFMPLTLEVTPGNQVTGVTNGALLEIGRQYQAVSKPGAGQVFQSWSGFVQSTNPALAFIMQSNMLLHANFAPNPWLSVTGNYQGLITEEVEGQVSPLNSGSFLLTLTARGQITGKLRLRDGTFPFSGQAETNGAATIRVMRLKCTEMLTLTLQFDVAGQDAGILHGTVSSPTIYAGLSGNRSSGDATYAGRYSFRIFLSEGAGAPAGEGAGTILVDAHGNAAVSGTLGDGTPVVFSTIVFSDGVAPMHTPLYAGRGLLQGWVNFTTNAEPLRIGGTDLRWFKPANLTDRYHSGGFFARSLFMGTRYTPPATGDNALRWTAGAVGLDGGNLGGSYIRPIRVINNAVTVDGNSLHVAVTLAPRTGLFTLSFTHPRTGQVARGKGALLQFDPPYEGFGYPVSGIGGGWFLGLIESGQVLLLPDPPAEP